MKPSRTITGTVHLTRPADGFTDKTIVRVSAIQTPLSDAPARPVADIVLKPHWTALGPQDGIPFRLDNVPDDAILTAYVGEGNGEQLQPGDAITMESYPLDPTRSDGYQLTVKPI